MFLSYKLHFLQFPYSGPKNNQTNSREVLYILSKFNAFLLLSFNQYHFENQDMSYEYYECTRITMKGNLPMMYPGNIFIVSQFTMK